MNFGSGFAQIMSAQMHQCAAPVCASLQFSQLAPFLDTMDDLPDDFAKHFEDYSDQHLNETDTDVAEVPQMDFWVNGVLHTIISVSGIISMSQPIEYKSSFVP